MEASDPLPLGSLALPIGRVVSVTDPEDLGSSLSVIAYLPLKNFEMETVLTVEMG